MDEREKKSMLLLRSKLRQQRIKCNGNSEIYEVLSDVELEMTSLLDAYDNKESPQSKMDRLLDWLRQHPDLSKGKVAAWAGYEASDLRNVLAKRIPKNRRTPMKVPLKYLDKLIDYCGHYGFK